MPWVYLTFGVCFSVVSTLCTKLSHGATRLTPSVFWLLFQVATFFCIAQSMKQINMGVVYAVWCGAGIIFIEALDVMFFSHTLNWLRIFYMLVIMSGIFGLQQTTPV